MTICKFFIRGACNKGDNCNFDHVFPDEDYGRGARGGHSGTSVLKRDNSNSFDNSGNYNENKNYYLDNRSHQSRKYDYQDRNSQGYQNSASINYYNDRYSVSHLKQPDQRYSQQYHPQRPPVDRYHYDSRQSRSQQQSYQKPPELNIDSMYALIKNEVCTIESRRIWPLTSLCLVKLFGSLEDWYDYSPEELRLAAYIAKTENYFDGFKATLDKIILKSQAIRDFYKNTTKEASVKLKNYMKQPSNTIHPLVENEIDFSCINYSYINFNTSISDIGKAESLSAFGYSQPPAEDDEMSQSTQKSEDVFGVSQKSTVQSNFGFGQESKLNTNVFGGFAQGTNQASNIFGGFTQESKPHNNIFGDSQSDRGTNNVFSQRSLPSNNVFGFAQSEQDTSEQYVNDSQPRDLKKLFPSLNQTDLDVEILSFVWKGDSPFSRRSELTKEEYDQFTAAKFTNGKVPLVPPPKEFC